MGRAERTMNVAEALHVFSLVSPRMDYEKEIISTDEEGFAKRAKR